MSHTIDARWVWICSGLYYPVTALMILTIHSLEHYIYIVLSYIVLVAAQAAAFLAFPVAVPRKWREGLNGKTISERFLLFVQKYDGVSNCFPSMHVSTATLTALHTWNNYPPIGWWVFLFPGLISLSALFTKQHYIVDLPAGAALGYIVFKVFVLAYVV